MPLEDKIKRSKLKIKQFYDYMDGRVHISTSGGKDSTVLLHLIRSMYPDVVAVNSYEHVHKETFQFLDTIPNLIRLKPVMKFEKVIEKYGYPIISKDVSGAIYRYRRAIEKGIENEYEHLLTGKKKGDKKKYIYNVIPKKWQYLIYAPFKIGEGCCFATKKKPLKKFAKENDTGAFMGIRAEESERRRLNYFSHGCTIYTEGNEKSSPIIFWTEKDIWDYIKINNLKYSKAYDLGDTRTGCVGCLFGCQHDAPPNQIQKMYYRNEKLYNYFVDDLDYGRVLDYINIPYLPLPKKQQ